MTFEEFKQDFERFTKIDSPKLLAICEQQYNSYMRAKADCNFFEPLTREIDKTDIVSIYKENLYSMLNFNQIKPGQVHFLVQPSFDPESLLTIEEATDTYILKNTILEENYWYRHYADMSVITVPSTIYRGHLKKEIGDQVFRLIEARW